MRKAALIFVTSLLLLSMSSFSQDYSKIQIKVEKVAGSVYMLTGRGGNIGVCAGEDGILLIDTQYAALADKMDAALKSISDKPLRFVINTHYHGDHVGANAHFAALAPIIAHQNVRQRLASGSKARLGGEVKPLTGPELPTVTYNDRLWLHLNGEDIQIRHYPNGHTDGDSVVYFPKSKVIHLGDDFFNGGTYPFIDLQNGGNVAGLIAALEQLLPELPDDVKIIPGHGPLASKADLRGYLAMLQESSALVAAGMKQGKSLDQLKQEKLLSKWDSTLGNGFIKSDVFVETLFTSLKGKSE